MTEQELQTALEHDAAAKGNGEIVVRPLVLAAECLRNAALAARGAECALIACRPAALDQAKQAAELAVAALEQALLLIGMEFKTNE